MMHMGDDCATEQVVSASRGPKVRACADSTVLCNSVAHSYVAVKLAPSVLCNSVAHSYVAVNRAGGHTQAPLDGGCPDSVFQHSVID
jgi:hypothetical protein